MNKIIPHVLLSIVFALMNIESVAQMTTLCSTPQGDNHKKEFSKNKNLQNGFTGVTALASSVINVKVVFHIFNNCITSGNSDVAITQLNTAYNPYNISFSKLCDDFLPANADPQL